MTMTWSEWANYRGGYYPYLGDKKNPFYVPAPVPSEELRKKLFKYGNQQLITKIMFQAYFNKDRKFVAAVFNNRINKRFYKGKLRRNFRLDPMIPTSGQYGEDLYYKNHLDRSHLEQLANARSRGRRLAQKAGDEASLFSMIGPIPHEAHEEYSGFEGKADESKQAADYGIVSEFSGIFFDEDDPWYRFGDKSSDKAQIPTRHWKAITFPKNGELKTHAFIIKFHKDFLERDREYPDDLELYRATIDDLQETGFIFDDVMREADIHAKQRPIGMLGVKPSPQKISLNDIVF